MFKRMLIVCGTILIATAQSGCFGLYVHLPKECENEIPRTDIHDIFWLRTSSHKTSSKEEFLKEWGKPDEIIANSPNDETWIYRRKLWCGATPVFMLPLPLLLPVCDGFDRIEFKGSESTRLHTRRMVTDGGALPFGGGSDPICRHPFPSRTHDK